MNTALYLNSVSLVKKHRTGEISNVSGNELKEILHTFDLLVQIVEEDIEFFGKALLLSLISEREIYRRIQFHRKNPL